MFDHEAVDSVCGNSVDSTWPGGGDAGDEAVFNRLDADKNGRISRDELLKSDLVVVKDAKGQQQVLHRDMVKQGMPLP